jgi:cobalt/nickel transport protein
MKKTIAGLLIVAFLLCVNGIAFAHFGMVIPSDSMVMQGDNKTITIKLSFSHPMEVVGMEMTKPKVFGVTAKGRKQNLLERLIETKVMGHRAWQVDYTVERPGIYAFYVEPEPYWEPAEDCYIIHYTKTVVTAFGNDEGWDEELGLKTEIVPISKPFGLYAGNVFQGIVKLNGKTVPYAEVEVEYYNEDGKSVAPTDYMITQTIKADQNGVFTYAAPRAGWWGFAALTTADYKLEHGGKSKDVEIGAVLWIRFHDWKVE